MRHVIILLGIGLLVSSCAAPPKAVKTGSKISETPEWVQTMGLYKNGEGAIGSSPKSGLGSQVQRDDATLAARNSLSQNIDIKKLSRDIIQHFLRLASLFKDTIESLSSDLEL